MKARASALIGNGQDFIRFEDAATAPGTPVTFVVQAEACRRSK